MNLSRYIAPISSWVGNGSRRLVSREFSFPPRFRIATPNVRGAPACDRELRSEIHRPRALDLRANGAALARTVDAQLNQLVVEARRQTLRDCSRIRCGEHHIARQNHAYDSAYRIGDLLLADVEDVDRERHGSI